MIGAHARCGGGLVWWLACALALGACARHIPSHLELRAATDGDDSPIRPSSPFERLVKNDPWARHLSEAEQDTLIANTPEQAKREVEEALLAIESRRVSAGRALSRLERTWPDTALPALLRGYRMQLTQAQWGPAEEEDDGRRYTQAVSLITGLHESRPPEAGARPEWSWFVNPPPADVLPYAYTDRWVLRAWQASPALPLGSLATPVLEGTRQRLANTPEGALLLARSQPASGCPESSLSAWADLTLATELALQRASADRDHEQALWSDRRRAVQKTLQITGDPVAHLLESSHEKLVVCAADNRSGGGALLAAAAMRWTKGCAQGCDGLDRTYAIAQAGRWHEDVEVLARVWTVIALKEVIDTMEIARTTVMFRAAGDDLIDLLLTLSPGGVDGYPLYVERPDATFWGRLGQSVTDERITTWKGLKGNLCKILSDRARSAKAGVDDGFAEMLLHLQERTHLTCPR